MGQVEVQASDACGHKQRFSSLVDACAQAGSSGLDAAGFSSQTLGSKVPQAIGHDPAFLPTSSLYRPELEGRQGSFYNLSRAAGEARVGSMLPYGFARAPLPHVGVPFPVVFQVGCCPPHAPTSTFQCCHYYCVRRR